MKWYSSWQEALVDFIQMYGENYPDPYNLIAEFELTLKRNRNGACYMEK